MKLRLLMGVIFTLLAFAATIILAGNPVYIYIDPASLLAGIFIPHVLISFLTPLSDQKRMFHEILAKGQTSSKSIIEKGLSYLRSLKTMIITCSIATALLGIIGMMANLEDTASVGPNLAVCLIVTFYAALYILMVIEPLRLTAETKLQSAKES